MSDGKQSTRAFIAGVLAWHDSLPPTPASLLGKEVIKYAFVHIKTIVESGNEILGKADIKLEGLPESAEALSVSTWGYNVPVILAQKYANENKCS